MTSQTRDRHIPSLDGLRAVSIGLVLAGHTYQSIFHRSASREHPLALIVGNASLGVEVFFVISGYLITRLLMRERDQSGRIELTAFYVRRAYRILPAATLYVGVVAMLTMTGVLAVTPREFVAAASFTWNYTRGANAWPLEHLWSLSVEEQFYLLWPSLLIVTRARNARRTVLALIIAAPFVRFLQQVVSGDQGASYFFLHTRMDSLMFGCAAALLAGEPWLERLRQRLGSRVAVLACFTLIVSPMLTAKFGGRYIYLAGFSIEGVSIALTMLWLIDNPGSAAGRLLNAAPVARVGVLSYSLYLWQQLFLNIGNTTVTGVLPWNLLATIACAVASYHLVEQPALQLRKRRAHLGHRHLA